jgi:hypothetical protein
MKHITLLTSVLMLLPCAGYAASPSNASLKGSYAFQFTQTQTVTWSRSISIKCSGTTYSVTPFGQSIGTQILVGTMTFSGSGTITISYTEYGVFNQDASNAAASASCTGNPNAPVSYNPGNPVFDNDITESNSGTYTIGSSGSGSLTLAAKGSDKETILNAVLGDFNASGVAQVLLFMQANKNGGNGGTGTAILK